jgi:hypothetical protein
MRINNLLQAPASRGSKSLYFIAIAITAMFALVMSSHATLLVNDTWQESSRNDPGVAGGYADNNGVVGIPDGDGQLDSEWFTTASAFTSVTPGDLHWTAAASSAYSSTYFTPEATKVVLANPGDELKVTFVYTPTGVNAINGSQGLSIGLGNTVTAGGRISTDTSLPNTDVYAGYSMFMNVGQTLSNSSPFQLKSWATPGSLGSFLGTSGNWASLVNGVASGTTGFANGTQYTFVFDLKRDANNSSLDVMASISGGSYNNSGFGSVSYVDNSPQSWTYDTFAFRSTSSATTEAAMDISDFKVELIPGVVPEPSTWALVAAGLGLMIGVFRRNRR